MSDLDDRILRFKKDVEIAHEIIHGDENTSVTTEGGPVDSFAKVLARVRTQVSDALQAAGGIVMRKYDFASALKVHVQHDLNTRDFEEKIRDVEGNRIFANVKILDDNAFEIEFTSPEEGHVTVVFMTSV